MEDIIISENNLELPESCTKRIDNIVNRYFRDLERNVYLIKKADSNYYEDIFNIPSYIMAIGEAFEFFDDRSKWLEISYMLLERIKAYIQEGLYRGRISLFNGLSDVGLALYIFNKNTGYYEKFLQSINQLVDEWTKFYINEYIEKTNELKVFHYDAVYGLSGVGNYLLLFDNKYSNSLKKILNYLLVLSDEHIFNGSKVPNWHIKSENQIRDDEKLLFPSGNLNFGLSHGMAGPLVLLSKALHAGQETEGQLEAIKKIINIYDEFKFRDNKGIFFWPTQLDFDDYTHKVVRTDYSRRASWCYGNIGISRALYMASSYIGDAETKDSALQNIERISLLPKEELYLMSPILCHGYAGLLSILNITYKETKSNAVKLGMMNILEVLLNCYKEESVFGFENVEISVNGEEITVSENSFLEGTTGIVLTLISMLKKETNYENHLLIK